MQWKQCLQLHQEFLWAEQQKYYRPVDVMKTDLCANYLAQAAVCLLAY